VVNPAASGTLPTELPRINVKVFYNSTNLECNRFLFQTSMKSWSPREKTESIQIPGSINRTGLCGKGIFPWPQSHGACSGLPRHRITRTSFNRGQPEGITAVIPGILNNALGSTTTRSTSCPRLRSDSKGRGA